MFSRIAVSSGNALRRASVRGLLTPALRVPGALVSAASRVPLATTRNFSGLAEVLATELLEAERDHQIDQDLRDVTKEMSKMFTISDVAGNAEVKLTRKFKSEEIEVKFHCQDENSDFNAPSDFEDDAVQTEEVPEDLENGDYGVDFTVTIKRGGNKMEFTCNAGQTININEMRYIPSGTNSDSLDALYRGPQFDNLEETLQVALLQYLSERGIGEDMSFFIISYARDKEEREYQKWIKEFIRFTE